MHRPRFAAEYRTREEQDSNRTINSDEIRERVLTWLQCYNVHQGYEPRLSTDAIADGKHRAVLLRSRATHPK
jgi:hypothetical protein